MVGMGVGVWGGVGAVLQTFMNRPSVISAVALNKRHTKSLIRGMDFMQTICFDTSDGTQELRLSLWMWPEVRKSI